MLKSLNIKGLAVVDQLELEFATGMTVLTGETGAGKSILLTAMGLCLGDRADSRMLRPGVERAEVSLEFALQDAPTAKRWLLEQDLDDDEQCLIRRTIHTDGRSRAYVNGQPTTLQRLLELARHLLTIHGQHDHLHLLQSDTQRSLVDDSLSDPSLLSQCQQAAHALKSLTDELAQLTGGQDNNDQRIELLRYQIDELDAAEVESLNYDGLVEEHAELANLGLILSTGQSQLERIYDHEQSVHNLLCESLGQLKAVAELSSDLLPITEQLGEAVIQIEDASRELRRSLESKDLNPLLLQQLEDRMDLVHSLARKLQVNPQDLVTTCAELRQQLQALEQRDHRLAQLQSDIVQARQAYLQSALALSRARAETAATLGEKISTTLSTLGMPDGQCVIEITHEPEANCLPTGQDRIQFKVTTNPGLPPREIARVASGGELSRICLAVQVIASQRNSAPTLIFDEVDSGIGGGVAETVGIRLRQIGEGRQVLCVTHLPQVASQGHQHWFVSKNRQRDQTTSAVNELSGDARTQEIARMLGGMDISQKTLDHAEEMLQQASSA